MAELGVRLMNMHLVRLIFGLSFSVLLPSCSSEQKPPQIGGESVPAEHFKIDFSKKYDIYISRYSGDKPLMFPNSRFLGYTGDEVVDSKGLSSKAYSGFTRWLVIELTDGRKAYISSSSIERLEEPRAEQDAAANP